MMEMQAMKKNHVPLPMLEQKKDHQIYYVTFKKGCRTRPHIPISDQNLVAIKGKGIIVVFVNKIEIRIFPSGKVQVIVPA
jgi:quercetin dioxygenase-like cupin family protein